MLPSSTVENYLKHIYLQQLTLPAGGALVQMGALAAAIGVTPGSATTMVKALSESGLVHYEPYAGVRLTPAGERLAGLVIRRHRLVELFLVQVMGMSWDEVHDEAEQLEHVVSERLIERMDEMLGHPEVDPHGDPIPDAEGIIAHREMQNLLTCPVGVPLAVTRVADQDASFLRFLESSGLKPGQQLRVQARDEAADSVRVEREGGDELTIGARAASKLLVEVIASILLICVLSAVPALAQTPAAVPPAPFEITDNSFFVEEAFNQDPGVFQNLATVLREEGGNWFLGFTQEWPAPSKKHQLSYSVGVASVGEGTGAGDILLHYRYQVTEEDPGLPAISPRVSLILPVGDERRWLGHGSWGLQFNLPVSKQVGNYYLHGNAGFTWLPSVPTDHFQSGDSLRAAGNVALASPFVAGSVIYRLHPKLNVLMEAVVDWQEGVVGPELTDRETVLILSPGARWAWTWDFRQVVVGAAVPFTRVAGGTSVGVLGYFSYELPFRH